MPETTNRYTYLAQLIYRDAVFADNGKQIKYRGKSEWEDTPNFYTDPKQFQALLNFLKLKNLLLPIAEQFLSDEELGALRQEELCPELVKQASQSNIAQVAHAILDDLQVPKP